MDGHFKKIIKDPGNRRMQIEYVPLLNLSWLLKMMKQLGRVDIIQRKSRTSVEHIPPSSLPFLFAVNESPLCPSRCHCLVSLCRHKENHILHSQFLAQPVVPLHWTYLGPQPHVVLSGVLPMFYWGKQKKFFEYMWAINMKDFIASTAVLITLL